jgi:hypothetical protein
MYNYHSAFFYNDPPKRVAHVYIDFSTKVIDIIKVGFTTTVSISPANQTLNKTSGDKKLNL